ncbi:hypothetical protein MKX01_028066 [Papaver californicum]|nr:hypothetical protein MKX01_028066 [Papaver californicum]
MSNPHIITSHIYHPVLSVSGFNDGSSRYGISKTAEEFMAGVLEHLTSVLAFVSPLPNSYDQIQPITWSGAYHCWGTENREAPLRTIKTFDGCANPHLGLASIIASGIDGLRRHHSLPEPILHLISLSLLALLTLSLWNITNLANIEGLQRLPNDLGECVETLVKDAFLKEFIGEKLVRAIIGFRKAEIAYYSKNKDAFKELIHKY